MGVVSMRDERLPKAPFTYGVISLAYFHGMCICSGMCVWSDNIHTREGPVSAWALLIFRLAWRYT